MLTKLNYFGDLGVEWKVMLKWNINMDWIQLPDDEVQWRVVTNTLLDLNPL
jgi:hypothetical protein